MLNEFKTNFLGGTRGNRFLIEGTVPTGGRFTRFHVRSTIIPQLTTKTLTYDYFGRKYHYPGERDYGNWAFTVLDDTGQQNNLWHMFQNWHNDINNHETNQSFDISDGRDYKAYNWKIKHLNMNGDEANPLKEFVLQGCWPASVSQLPLNMLQPNTLNSFNVIIIYDYIEIKNITSRNT
jgi:hypothetical protein